MNNRKLKQSAPEHSRQLRVALSYKSHQAYIVTVMRQVENYFCYYFNMQNNECSKINTVEIIHTRVYNI